jgi:hypothetical protein
MLQGIIWVETRQRAEKRRTGAWASRTGHSGRPVWEKALGKVLRLPDVGWSGDGGAGGMDAS